MINKTLSRRRGSSCFRPAVDSSTTTATTTTNLTTSLYHTRLGVIALTWSHSFLGRRSVVIHHPHHSHRLSVGPFLFWRKHGSVQFPLPSGPATLTWDLTRAKFGSRSGPEPESGFYIALLVDSLPILVVGDVNPKPDSGYPNSQSLVVRREHVQGTKLHATKAVIGGKTRGISIECNDSDPDPRLVIRVDGNKVLQVKHLKWKFRGGERIDIDGHPVLISWDVYNWLFDDCDKGEGFALFTFRFENEMGGSPAAEIVGEGGERVLLTEELPAERGWRKKKGLVANTRSGSSLASMSASSASSACGSVLEWESVEESELKGPTGFSLLVYSWKS